MQKIYTLNDFLFVKSKKPYSWGIFGHSPKNQIFSKKSGSARFLALRHSNFMGSSRKILSAVLEKTRLTTDQLTYWHIDILTVVKS